LTRVCHWIALAAVTATTYAVGQASIPQQPAAGQSPEGTAAATAGKNTPDVSGNPAQPPNHPTAVNPPDASSANDSDENRGLMLSPSAPKPGPLPQVSVEDPTDTSDLMPIPAMPEGSATLVGGIVRDIDPLNDRLTVQPFGTKSKMKVFFDERSKIYRNGKAVGPIAIHKGDKIYLDTQLDKGKGKVFARNVRVQTRALQADAQGQIVGFNQQRNMVSVRDDLSGQAISFYVRPNASVDNQGHPGSLADLQPGALVTARFLANQEGRNEVDQIVILAAPGSDYNFDGKLTHLDVRNHVLGIENAADGKIYDIRYDPQKTPIGDLQVGSIVSVTARFNGQQYDADSLSRSEGLSLEDQDQASKDAKDGQGSHSKSKKDKKDKSEGGDAPK
jgi:hypothetical protein